MRATWTIATLLLTSAPILNAANITKALNEAEGRMRAARTGVQAIKSKSPERAAQAEQLYAATATAHNTWLDATCEAITSATATTSDVAALSASAGSSFVRWVVARNQILGEPVLEGSIATSVEEQVKRELADITTEMIRSSRGVDANKRTRIASDLRKRLQWQAWSELRSTQ